MKQSDIPHNRRSASIDPPDRNLPEQFMLLSTETDPPASIPESASLDSSPTSTAKESEDHVGRQKERDSFLKDEYLFLQKTYEDFDQRLLVIKGWSVTTSLAGLAIGFQFKIPPVWLVAAGSALVFWSIETTWKSFQYAYSGRIRTIEAYFREENKEELKPFQIYNSWYETYRSPSRRPLYVRAQQGKISSVRQWSYIATMPMIMLPHVLIIIAALIMFFWHMHRPFWKDPPQNGALQMFVSSATPPRAHTARKPLHPGLDKTSRPGQQ